MSADRQETRTEPTQAEDAEQGRFRGRLRRPAISAFDPRTDRWRAVGLSMEIERAEARRAAREAVLLAVLIIAVLLVFGFRGELFPDAKKIVRFVTAGVLVVLGWALARTAAKGIAPRLLRRMDPATAGTVGFVVRLGTILVVIFGSLAIAGVRPEALAVGGAFTAVVLGLAAQQTLGNVIAGAVLLGARPFRVGDRVRIQGGFIAGNIEGTVASLGLFYTVLASGADRILIPNNTLMTIAVTPLREPEAVELLARFDASAITPGRLEEVLTEHVTVPLRRAPRVELEELGADDVLTLRISLTPDDVGRGAELAAEVLEAIRIGGGEGETDERPAAAGDSDAEA